VTVWTREEAAGDQYGREENVGRIDMRRSSWWQNIQEKEQPVTGWTGEGAVGDSMDKRRSSW
jgi:hypothetical protein